MTSPHKTSSTRNTVLCMLSIVPCRDTHRSVTMILRRTAGDTLNGWFVLKALQCVFLIQHVEQYCISNGICMHTYVNMQIQEYLLRSRCLMDRQWVLYTQSLVLCCMQFRCNVSHHSVCVTYKSVTSVTVVAFVSVPCVTDACN